MLKRAGTVIIALSVLAMLSLAVCNSYAQTAEEDILRNGVDLSRHGQYDEAIAEFNKVIVMDPKSSGAYSGLGFAYDKKGDLSGAILNFTKAIELDPGLVDVYYNRGFTYYKKGAYDSAVADYNKILQISPDYADAYYGLGLVYSKKGDLDNAIREYTKAVEAKVDFALAYDARAVAYVMKKNYLGAMSDVNKAQSLSSRSRPPRIARAGSSNAAGGQVVLSANQAQQPNQAQTIPLKVAGLVFLVVSFMHLLRLIFRVKVTIGKFSFPLWLSAAAFLATLFLALWLLGIH